MNTDGQTGYELAPEDSPAPTASSYWGVSRLLLARAYTGHPAPNEHQAKVEALLGAGIRTHDAEHGIAEAVNVSPRRPPHQMSGHMPSNRTSCACSV